MSRSNQMLVVKSVSPINFCLVPSMARAACLAREYGGLNTPWRVESVANPIAGLEETIETRAVSRQPESRAARDSQSIPF